MLPRVTGLVKDKNLHVIQIQLWAPAIDFDGRYRKAPASPAALACWLRNLARGRVSPRQSSILLY